MKNIKTKKIVLDILIILLAIITVTIIFLILKKDVKASASKRMVKEFILTTTKIDSKTENNIKNVSNNNNNKENITYKDNSDIKLSSYRKRYNNNDIVGILSINGTKINTLLLQTDNNTYYQRRLPNKKKHITGSVFIDYRTKLNKDKNVIIYGHNANNYDIPFRYLRNYLDKDFYDKNKYININTDEKDFVYEIFSVFTIKDDYRYLDISFPLEKDFLNHLEYLKSKSIYGTSTSLSSSDSIITLQTCLLKDDALIIICAKKIK